MNALLSLRGLHLTAPSGPLVRGVDLDIAAGETLALVGESGSGKSLTALAILNLLPPGVRRQAERLVFDGTDLQALSEPAMRRLRGRDIGMVFQEPLTALNPLHTVQRQVAEPLRLHAGLRGRALRERVLSLLDRAGLPQGGDLLAALPHQLSGGQRQRVMIAMALANAPKLLIADEPTTALDVTVQAQILKLLRRLQDEMGLAILLITHDMGVVRALAHRVTVLRAGQVVEAGPRAELLQAPQAAYTKSLLAAMPAALDTTPRTGPDVLSVNGLTVRYGGRGGLIRRSQGLLAVHPLDLSLKSGETLGIVGESGSGKSSLALAMLRLIRAQGQVRLNGQTLPASERAMRPLRAGIQIVFQDPYGALSPRQTVGATVAEGLRVHRPALTAAARRERVTAMLAEVGLPADAAERLPHVFSGGQRQRIAIARALILEPAVLILDEPTSALDLSVQAQVLDLLKDLQARRGLAYLFISHDLAVIRAMAHRVLVMKDGVVVESGSTQEILERPRVAYTQRLVQAALDPMGV